MKKVNINYSTELIIDAGAVYPKGCTSISFENLGTSNCTILGNVPLNPANDVREFKNDPGEEIKTSFPISFSGAGTKEVLVIRTYTEICN